MATAVVWLVGSVLMFLEFGAVACSACGRRRRAGFYRRLGCSSLVMVLLALGLAFALRFNALPERAFGLVWLALLLAALAVAPVFWYDTLGSSQGSSDGDGGGGPGSGPPPTPPTPPTSGVPLPDAEQARARRRDHTRPNLRGVMPRRPAVKPMRPHAPTGPERR